jgi:hypothetical protein
MSTYDKGIGHCCGRVSRRAFLADLEIDYGEPIREILA